MGVVLEAEGGGEGVADGGGKPEVGDGGVDGREERRGEEGHVVAGGGVCHGDGLDGEGEGAVVVVVERDLEGGRGASRVVAAEGEAGGDLGRAVGSAGGVGVGEAGDGAVLLEVREEARGLVVGS